LSLGVSFDVLFRDFASGPLGKIQRAGEGLFSRLEKYHKNYQRQSRRSSKSTEQLGSAISGIQGKVAALVGGVSLGLFAKGVVDVTAEYEKFNAVLTNTFQSSTKAAQSMNMLQRFAAKTPFQINQLTDSYIKLVNRGFNPTEAEMTKLGDLASSLGKPFDQLTEAILDSQAGEMERLKEFGIRAAKAGNQVSFTFKGQTKTVQNSEKAIRDYILSLGDMKGVAGGMAMISDTLGGKLSNLQDAFDQLRIKIGTKLRPVITYFVDAGNKAISFFSEFFEKVDVLKGPLLKLYEATQPIRQAFQSLFERLGFFNQEGSMAETVLRFLNDAIIKITPFIQFFSNILGGTITFIRDNWEGIKLLTIALIAGKLAFAGFNIAIGVYNAVMTVARIATIAMAGKMSLLNITMLANPVGLVIAGVAALVAGFIYAYKQFDKFRGAILGVWAGLKEFGKGIADIVITRVKELVSALSGVGKMLGQLFDRDFSGAWETGKGVVKNLAGVHSIQTAIETGKKAGQAFSDAYDEEAGKKNPLKKVDHGYGYFRDPSMVKSDSGEDYFRDTSNPLATATKTTNKTSLDAGIDSIKADKKISKVINVNIDKLVESFTVATNNIKEAPTQIKQLLEEALVDAVRDAELSLT
jgi:hypothetical protein